LGFLGAKGFTLQGSLVWYDQTGCGCRTIVNLSGHTVDPLSVVDVVVSETSRGSDQTPVSVAAVAEGSVSPSENTSREELSPSVSPSAETPSRGSSLVETPLRRPVDGVRRGLFGSSSPQSSAEETTRRSPDLPATTLDLSRDRSRSPSEDGRPSGQCELSPQLSTSTAADALYVPEIATAQPPDPSGSQGLERASAQLTPKRKAPPALPVAVVPAVPDEAPRHSPLGIRATVPADRRHPSAVPDVARKRPTAQARPAIAPPRSSAHFQPVPDKAPTCPPRLLKFSYLVGKEGGHGLADDPAPGCTAEQRRDEEAGGYAEAVGPAGQKVVADEEHAQRRPREGSCRDTKSLCGHTVDPLSVVDVVVSETSRGSDQTPVSVAAVAEGSVSPSENTSREELSPSVSPSAETPSRGSSLVETPLRRPVDGVRRGLFGSSSPQSSAEETTRRSPDLPATTLDLSRDRSRSPSEDGRPSGQCELSPQLSTSTAADALYVPEIATAQPPDPSGSQGLERASAQLTPKRKAPPALPVAVVPAVPDEAPRHSPLGIRATVPADRRHPSAVPDVARKRPTAQARPAIAPPRSSAHFQPVPDKAPTCPPRLLKFSYLVGKEGGHGLADDPAPGCTAEQRRDEEAGGYAEAVGPAGQKVVADEEHAQRRPREGSCRDTKSLWWC
ncbi:nascent polypeptide-associated complex subunit alpha, muscle-specific form-like, partial [Palaemon carinicauda]|uniref:nascent polypeptide-associated complex subunit alpha, muscle-specific form-like n=1 Tax=Palaemon carinicauda TaxID=392227 RepID=UPI0035B659D5